MAGVLANLLGKVKAFGALHLLAKKVC